jgi:hypothetical protein
MRTKKNRKTIFGIMGGMDAAVSNNNGVFAKQKLQRIKLTWMSILFALAIITMSLALFACEEECNCNPQTYPNGTGNCKCGMDDCKCKEAVKREFNDLAKVRGKSVTLVDETNGATDLKAQGVWGNVNTALGAIRFSTAASAKFDGIYSAGGEVRIIIVNGDSDSNYAVDGHDIKLHLDLVSSESATNIGSLIATLIGYVMVARGIDNSRDTFRMAKGNATVPNTI